MGRGSWEARAGIGQLTPANQAGRSEGVFSDIQGCSKWLSRHSGVSTSSIWALGFHTSYPTPPASRTESPPETYFKTQGSWYLGSMQYLASMLAEVVRQLKFKFLTSRSGSRGVQRLEPPRLNIWTQKVHEPIWQIAWPYRTRCKET